mmetsp:Transcript_71762/g.165965  ORF Transcript_71762/g.165965 Transcript_71762/m.165965 type:complete len:95 (+) Transcript_71762:1014-1298(+)
MYQPSFCEAVGSSACADSLLTACLLPSSPARGARAPLAAKPVEKVGCRPLMQARSKATSTDTTTRASQATPPARVTIRLRLASPANLSLEQKLA